MATSASQTYIAKLGFSDPDRAKDRHGLACEYLYERLLETEIAAPLMQAKLDRLKGISAKAAEENQKARQRLEQASESNLSWLRREREDLIAAIGESFNNYQNAEAEIAALSATDGMEFARQQYAPSDCINVPLQDGRYTVGFADVLIRYNFTDFLGEVKIARQPAEQVLQQINFYKLKLRHESVSTIVLVDYDCSDLQRLVSGSRIKVYRLGRRFENWLINRAKPVTDEL